MSAPGDRSLADLIASLARDIPDLFSKELHLARNEAKAALDHLIGAVGRLTFALALAVAAIGLALAAMVSALTTWLIAQGMEPPLAGTVATASVTLVSAAIAGALFWSARRSLRAARSALDGSVATLAESAANVMEKF